MKRLCEYDFYKINKDYFCEDNKFKNLLFLYYFSYSMVILKI